MAARGPAAAVHESTHSHRAGAGSTPRRLSEQMEKEEKREREREARQVLSKLGRGHALRGLVVGGVTRLSGCRHPAKAASTYTHTLPAKLVCALLLSPHTYKQTERAQEIISV